MFYINISETLNEISQYFRLSESRKIISKPRFFRVQFASMKSHMYILDIFLTSFQEVSVESKSVSLFSYYLVIVLFIFPFMHY